MTTDDPMTAQERALRDRLQAELAPPATPDRLAYAVDRLAQDELGRASSGRLEMLVRAGTSRWVKAVIALTAVVAIAGATLLMGTTIRNRVPVAATPIPTLPAITGPSLPPDAQNPTRVGSGRWFDAISAFLFADGIMETRDGGLTWQQTGRVPVDMTAGADMLDLEHGYAGDVQTSSTGLRLFVSTTSDGGSAWQSHVIADVSSPAFGSSYAEVHFTDPEHGIALAATMSPYPAGSEPPVFCPVFGTNGRGQACTVIPLVCAGFATADGGATWTPLDSPPCLTLGGVRWYTPRLGINSSLDGRLSTTTDGGRTWHTGSLPGVVDGKSFLSGNNRLTVVSGTTLRLAGVVVTDGDVAQPMTVWESSDAGTSWHVSYTADLPTVLSAPDANGIVDRNANLADMWAFGADHWIAMVSVDGASSAPGGLFETWDAGRSWTDAAPQQIVAGGVWQWADRLHGMINGGYWRSAGNDGWNMVGNWLITNDGGQTWHQVPF